MKAFAKIIARQDRFWLIRFILIKVIFLLLLSTPLQIILLPEFPALYVIYAVIGLIAVDVMLFNHHYKKDQLYLFFVISVIVTTKILSIFAFNNILLITASIFAITVLFYVVKSAIKIYSVVLLGFILSLFIQKVFSLSDLYHGANFSLYFFICASYLFWVDKILSSLYERIWRATSGVYIEQTIDVIKTSNSSYSIYYAIFERLKLIKNKNQQVRAKRFYDSLVEYNYFIHWLKKSNVAILDDFDNIVSDLKILQIAVIYNHVAFHIVSNSQIEHMQIHNELFNKLVNSWNELCK
ncbi:MAG: hypothetical protein PHC75_02645 [Burkholderiales bacterium]|nr:hypothetical protein [Burkholderiales bacterium]